MVRRVRQDSGFTLIEVLVSALILMICLAAIMELFSVVSLTNTQNEIRNKMVRTLVNYVDNVTTSPFSSITSQTESGTVRIRSAVVPYTINSNVTSAVLPGGIGKKTVSATIGWNYRNRSYSYSVTTVVVNE